MRCKFTRHRHSFIDKHRIHKNRRLESYFFYMESSLAIYFFLLLGFGGKQPNSTRCIGNMLICNKRQVISWQTTFGSIQNPVNRKKAYGSVEKFECGFTFIGNWVKRRDRIHDFCGLCYKYLPPYYILFVWLSLYSKRCEIQSIYVYTYFSLCPNVIIFYNPEKYVFHYCKII